MRRGGKEREARKWDRRCITSFDLIAPRFLRSLRREWCRSGFWFWIMRRRRWCWWWEGYSLEQKLRGSITQAMCRNNCSWWRSWYSSSSLHFLLFSLFFQKLHQNQTPSLKFISARCSSCQRENDTLNQNVFITRCMLKKNFRSSHMKKRRKILELTVGDERLFWWWSSFLWPLVILMLMTYNRLDWYFWYKKQFK